MSTRWISSGWSTTDHSSQVRHDSFVKSPDDGTSIDEMVLSLFRLRAFNFLYISLSSSAIRMLRTAVAATRSPLAKSCWYRLSCSSYRKFTACFSFSITCFFICSYILWHSVNDCGTFHPCISRNRMTWSSTRYSHRLQFERSHSGDEQTARSACVIQNGRDVAKVGVA